MEKMCQAQNRAYQNPQPEKSLDQWGHWLIIIIARAQNSGILVARGAKSGQEQIKGAEMLKFGLYPKGKELPLSGGKQGICLHIEICFCLH